MLGCVHTDSTETYAHEVSEVGSDSLADVVGFGIEVEEATQPAVVKLEGVSPGVKSTIAVEVSCNVGDRGELIARLETSVVRILPSERVGEVWRGACGGLGAPVGAPATAAVSVARPYVIASTTHMVNDCVGIDTHTRSSAGLDHITELLSGTVTAV